MSVKLSVLLGALTLYASSVAAQSQLFVFGRHRTSAVAPFAFVAGTGAGSAIGDSITTSSIDSTGANTLVAVVSSYIPGGTTSIIDSKSNTWSCLTITGQQNLESKICYAKNATVGSGHTFTVPESAVFACVAAAAFSGGGVTAPFDQQNGTTDNTGDTTVQSGSITPGQDNELVIGALGFEDPNTLSIDGGFTITNQVNHVDSQHYGCGLAYLIQTTAAAANPTWTLSTSTDVTVSSIASFKVFGN